MNKVLVTGGVGFIGTNLIKELIKKGIEVVSIDNSTVHFAGALNKKCQVLLPYSSDWRWGLTGEKSSYWYGSLNLHWQSSLGDWSSALQSLKEEY